MTNKYLYAVVVIVLTTLLACQNFQMPFQKDKQIKTYIEKAQAFETEGNYVKALEQYKLAQTIDPDQQDINDNVKRLKEKLDNLAEVHYRAGLRFRDRGKWTLAKKSFLQALHYNPDHKKAAAMLQQRPPDKSVKYITHVIKPQESLSRLSIRYYGDYRKYHYIANFNNLPNATRVKVGQKIMIPAIAGVTIEELKRIESGTSGQPPAVDQEQAASPVSNQIDTPSADVPEPPPEIPPEIPEVTDLEETEPVVDQVAEYRETGIALFKEKKYDDALLELQKVLSAEPEDADAIRYISLSYVGLGRGYLDERRIDEAKHALGRALEYDENCQECRNLLEKCRRLEGEMLRGEGETLLRAKQYDDAAATFEHALALNPDDPLASDLLFQSHYQKALGLYDEGKYLKAKTGFEKAATVKPDCVDCQQYIEDSLEAYKERHYNAGIVYFDQEKLRQAISSWEKVVAVDPNYKNVQENLRKAMLLNERLEQIRQQLGQ